MWAQPRKCWLAWSRIKGVRFTRILGRIVTSLQRIFVKWFAQNWGLVVGWLEEVLLTLTRTAGEVSGMQALQGTTEASHTTKRVSFAHLPSLESTLKPDSVDYTKEGQAFPVPYCSSFSQLQTWKGERSKQTSRWGRMGSKDERSQTSPTLGC